MKQPEVFKNLKYQFEHPFTMDGNDNDYIKRLRNTALEHIAIYKNEKKRIDKRKKEQEEVLKYFDYLDNLDKS